jgi:hypothetical protein
MFVFYRQWELTNISRTSHIVQNLSCDMSYEHKVPNSVSTKPKHCHWWKLDNLEGASVNKAVPTTKGFRVQNKNFWTMWIRNRIFVVFSCIYRQKTQSYSRVWLLQTPPKEAAVVLELLEPLFHRGHTLWIDNFNSTELTRKLKIEHPTDCAGTLGRNIQQLSYRIQLVEGVFTKYACAGETQNVPGRQASENTVQRLTERHFLRKLAPKTPKCIVCSKHGEKKLQCTAAKYVMWAFAWKIALSCSTRSSITEVMTIILLNLYSLKVSLQKF